ncbi:hypothetical protein [Comamonas thiooxydans]|uniref:hypothetical protein n=1 Tax=Comamonas thiooxydans TaxID=363952 RepID=UPI00057B74B9|nr:hypothetical protein [Comamonas thiooxydans]
MALSFVLQPKYELHRSTLIASPSPQGQGAECIASIPPETLACFSQTMSKQCSSIFTHHIQWVAHLFVIYTQI